MSELLLEETKTPQAPWECVMDIKRRNEQNRDTYDAEYHALADDIKHRASQAWSRSRCFLNYRDRFIAIKVDRPTRADATSKEVETFDRYCELVGVKKHVTRSSIVYRIMR